MSRVHTWPLLGLCTLAAAQPATAPLYSVVLAQATTQAIHYPFLDGSTLIRFRGTPLAPAAAGQAMVRGEGGRMRIHAHFRGLQPPSQFGPEYFTYVLWAISPLGRAVNLGEVVAVRGKAHIDTQIQLPSFALVLTAEPHFAVTRVSQAVVMENVADRRARPAVEEVEARYELLPRGSYGMEPVPAAGPRDRGVSPYVFQARGALRIAQREQADVLAPAEYRLALAELNRMEGARHLKDKAAVLAARRAVQQAEDARIVAERHREAQRLDREREAAGELRAQLEEAQARAEAVRLQAAADAQRAHREARAATEAQLAMRRRLTEQLNQLLRTQETAEGLQATLTDVAFASGRSQISAPARENLAKVAGILLTCPGLKIRVLGHTDTTGRPAFNERLSRQRAEAVRLFLVDQGLPSGRLLAEGLGSSRPVASNDTPEGRKRNRRVDLIVSGEAIGI